MYLGRQRKTSVLTVFTAAGIAVPRQVTAALARVRTDHFSNNLADKKLHSYCYLVGGIWHLLNPGLLFSTVCFRLSLRNSRSAQKLLSSCFLP